MAKKIGGPSIRPTSQQTAKRLQEQKAQTENRELGLKNDIQQSKSGLANIAKQGLKTDKDKELSQGPEERVTLSRATVSEADSAAKESVDVPKSEQGKTADGADSVSSGAPQEKASVDFESEFLSTLTQSVDQDAMASIGQKTNESLQKLSMGGAQEVNQGPVLAAHSFNHAKNVLSEKMPNASLKELRDAAKSDPEIAKYVQLLDSSKAYMSSVKKEAQSSKTPESGASAEGTKDGAAVPPTGGGATPPPSDGSSAAGPLSADPFAGTKGLSEGGQQQAKSAGEDTPFYHKSPQEQAELIRERNSQMNEIMKIYAQMREDNRKAMAERHALIQATNQEIAAIFLSIHANRARAMDKHNDTYMKIITGAWGP